MVPLEGSEDGLAGQIGNRDTFVPEAVSLGVRRPLFFLCKIFLRLQSFPLPAPAEQTRRG